MDFLIWLILLLLLSGMGGLGFFLLKKIKKERVQKSLDMCLFLIMMPKYEQKTEREKPKGEKKLIAQMEQIYAYFLHLEKPGFFKKMIYGSPRVVFEIASEAGGEDISFYVSVSKSIETAFEKYVQGVYPRALLEKVPGDYTVFEPKGITSASYLKLKDSSFFPINTYQDLEKDPLAVITNALSKIAPEEGAAIQIVIKPFNSEGWKGAGKKILSEIGKGKSPKTVIVETSQPSGIKLLKEMSSALSGRSDAQKQKDLEQKRFKDLRIDEEAIKAIQSKIKKEVFETNIRLMASAQTKGRADEVLGHLESVFSQFSLSGLNGFKPIRAKKRILKRMIYDFSFRNFNPNQKNILNIEELTSIYHFPTFSAGTPYVKTVKSGTAPPAAGLSEKGLLTIGEVTFRGEKKNVAFVSRSDRRRHFYIIGQTGTGKTSLLREMIRQDIENGEGVGVIDPHGELIDFTLANVPKTRVEDVVLFEPFDLDWPVGLNMLEHETAEQKDFAIQEMISIFHKLFPPEIIGPMFEHYMRNALLAIMADKKNPGTLVEIPRMFTDERFMESKLEKVVDPMVRNFWLKEWKQITGATKSDMLGYVVSKVGRFIENEMMRNIIGQPYSGFNLGDIMNKSKIFLANLSKGLTGDVNSSLLGLILVSKLQMAAMRRAGMSEQERKDFYLYIDEFQNFTTDSIAVILSEARKYKLNLILAHQYIPQLTDEIRSAVLGNTGTIAAFRVGADDAEFLEKQFEPEFSRFDLMNLDNFNLIIKMMINDSISSSFKMQTIFPQKGRQEVIEPIKKISKLKYSRPKKIVESEILQKVRVN